MHAKYQLRVVKEEDRSGILSLAQQLGYSASEQSVNDLVTIVVSEENQQMVLAEEGDRLQGYIHLICNCSDRVNPRVEIAGILIPDKFRGKGLGSAFVKEAEKWSRSKDIKLISIRRSLIRNEALAFFRHHGFSPAPSGDILIKQLA